MSLSERQLELLQAVEDIAGDNIYADYKDVANRLGLNISTVRREFDALQGYGYVSISAVMGDYGDWSVRLEGPGQMVLLNPGFSKYKPNASSFNFFGTANIAVLNAGQMGNVNSITQNIGDLLDKGNQGIAEAIKQVTEAVIKDTEISDQDRGEVLDMLDALSKQATLPPTEQKKGVIKSLLVGAGTALGTTAALAEIWGTWGSTITGFFNP
jgi:hypothetical protein